METRANYVLIGLFTLAAIFGAAGFIYWFQHLDGATKRTTFLVEFAGSVSGLRTASAVLFNGMRVGEVTALKPKDNDPSQIVVATISVDDTISIRPDTQIGLEFQGLTGIASISMRGGSAQPVLKSDPKNPTVLRADPALTRDMTAAARDVLAKFDKVIADNEAALRTTIRNLETVTDTLARNSGRFDSIMAGIDNLAGGKDGNGEIQQAARSVKQLADNLDKRTSDMASELSGAAVSFRQLTDNLDKRTADITAGINRFANTGSREFESLAADGRRALAELERTIRNFDKNPSRLLFGGGGGVPEYNGRR